MQSISVIRETYPDAKYFGENIDKKKKSSDLKTLVVATKIKGQKPWYEDRAKFKFIPRDLVEEVNSLRFPIYTPNLYEDDLLLEEAAKSVIACQVISIIESQPFLMEEVNGHKKGEESDLVLLNDILVMKPVDSHLSELRIYVSQMRAGAFQPKRLSNMIGSIFPVKVLETWETRLDNYHLSKRSSNNFVVEGSIEAGAWIRNTVFLKEYEAAKAKAERKSKPNKNDLEKFRDKVRHGIVVRVTARKFNNSYTGGIYVLTQSMETVYIPMTQFSYKSRSRYLKVEDIVNINDQVAFKVREVSKLTTDKNQNQLMMNNQYIQGLGSRLDFEVDPYLDITDAIDKDELVGTYHEAYIVDYNIPKNHLVELVDYPGVSVKLKHAKALSEKLAARNTPITVMIERARYNLKDKTLPLTRDNLSMTVYCVYKGSVNVDGETFSGFFN